jgi:hypothetical protein
MRRKKIITTCASVIMCTIGDQGWSLETYEYIGSQMVKFHFRGKIVPLGAGGGSPVPILFGVNNAQ